MVRVGGGGAAGCAGVVSTSAGIQRGAYRPLAKVSSVVRLALVAASIFFVLVGSAAATRIVGVGGNKKRLPQQLQ